MLIIAIQLLFSINDPYNYTVHASLYSPGANKHCDYGRDRRVVIILLAAKKVEIGVSGRMHCSTISYDVPSNTNQ